MLQRVTKYEETDFIILHSVISAISSVVNLIAENEHYVPRCINNSKECI